jgi:hypothetical protein
LSDSVQDIFRFLGVDQQEIPIQKTNKSVDMTPSMKHLRIMANVQKWIEQNQQHLDIISERDKIRINKRYGKIL